MSQTIPPVPETASSVPTPPPLDLSPPLARAKTASVLGIGKLGLCVALVLEHAGYAVVGVDLSQGYLDALNQKTLFSQEPAVNELLQQSRNFTATNSLEDALAHSDLLYLCVATPTLPGRAEYDCSAVDLLLDQLNERKVDGKTVVIGCTVMPGYTRAARLRLSDCTNTTLSYSPNFIAQGTIVRGLTAQDLILIGAETEEAGDQIETMYLDMCAGVRTPTVSGEEGNLEGRLCSATRRPIPACVRVPAEAKWPELRRTTPLEAEISKIGLNCFLTTKIAFANYLSDLCLQSGGADPATVLQTIGFDSRIGPGCLVPGFGYGGPCLPRDNRALGFYAKSVGLAVNLPNSVDRANHAHAVFQAELLHSGREIHPDVVLHQELVRPTDPRLGRKVTGFSFYHVSYKSGFFLLDESQKLKVAKLLVELERTHGTNRPVTLCDTRLACRAVASLPEYAGLFQFEELGGADEPRVI